MNKIGFKNFRIFAELPSIDLGGITVLVGANNTGKSTLVKGALLMHDFIQTRIGDDKASQSITGNEEIARPLFMLDSERVNLGNFYRAICRSNNGRTISFEYGLDEFTINTVVKGGRKSDDAPEAEVSSIGINDTISNIEINIDFNKDRIKIKFGACKNEKEIERQRQRIKLKIGYISFKIRNNDVPVDSFEDYSNKAMIEQLNKELEALDSKYTYQEEVVTIDLHEVLGYNSDDFLLSGLIRAIVSYSTNDRLCSNLPVSDIYSQGIPPKEIIRNRVPFLNRMAFRLQEAINNEVVQYVDAYPITPKSFDGIGILRHDFVATVADMFYQAHITENDYEYIFLQRWLEEFEIGSSVVVNMDNRGDYHVLVDKENLGDKGLGSIRMTILLMLMAVLIREKKNKEVTVMLEDPEQYLYPALQSKLAELVNEVHATYGFNFVVETHSEYFVRSSQIIVGMNYDTAAKAPKNPFKILCMPQHGLPYSIGYTKSGRLTDKFEPGFIDEAGKANFFIMRKERGLEI